MSRIILQYADNMPNDHIRAYINPQPSLSEAEQRKLVDKYEPGEIYVETRDGEGRDAFIKALRPGDIALVAELFCLARAMRGQEKRYADLLRAERDIADQNASTMEASSAHQSTDRKTWAKMRDRAYDILGSAVKKGKVGKKPFEYTPAELQAMQAVMESRKYGNWPERKAAIVAKGIKAPGRTWAIQKLPGLVEKVPPIEATKAPRRKASRVYFLRDGDAVKIGHSVEPKKRRSQISTCRPLELLLTIPGGREREAALHKKFARYRIKGEWFQMAPAILEFIEAKKK